MMMATIASKTQARAMPRARGHSLRSLPRGVGRRTGRAIGPSPARANPPSKGAQEAAQWIENWRLKSGKPSVVVEASAADSASVGAFDKVRPPFLLESTRPHA